MAFTSLSMLHVNQTIERNRSVEHCGLKINSGFIFMFFFYVCRYLACMYIYARHVYNQNILLGQRENGPHLLFTPLYLISFHFTIRNG